MYLKLSELAIYVQGKLLGADVIYTGFSIDSRHIKPGQLFIAIVGDRFDGHNFVELAKQRGAVAALVDRPMESDLPLLQVVDTRKALGAMATHHRHHFSIPIIALTGSCGKTTTKEMIVAILHESGSVLTNHKNFNNEIGVPLTLLNLTAQHRYAVIEMGANHRGEIASLSQMTSPDVALITNIEPAHLQGFGSMAGIAQAKAEIFSGLATKGVAIINADDNFSDTWQQQLVPYRVLRFGLSHKADFSATLIQVDAQGKASFILQTPSGEACSIGLTLPGQHHVMNALAAAAAASQLGARLVEIKAGLEKIQPVPGRINIITTKNGATLIDDSYNANPGSVAVALKLLAHYPGRHIFVMGDMGELGENADRYHREIGQLAKELNVEEVYTCGTLSALTAEEFGVNATHYTHQEALISALKLRLQNKVTMLIKGSRSARMDQVVAALTDQ